MRPIEHQAMINTPKCKHRISGPPSPTCRRCPLNTKTTHHNRFWMQAHIVCMCMIIPGMVYLWNSVLRAPRLPSIFVQLLPFLAVAAQAGMSYRVSDQGGNTFLADYARAAYDNLPEGAIVITKGDNSINLLRYLTVFNTPQTLNPKSVNL